MADISKENDTTVLIIDDTEPNVRLLAHVLKREGYEVLAAFSGEDALKLVEKKKPEIILLDIMMPGMDGFEVCERLKKKEETSDIPVIFLSALSETDSKVKGFKAGGVDYITKPFQREEVLARIELHLRLNRLQNRLEEKISQLKEREEWLNRLNAQKDELMRIVGHDIRNPVTGIIGVAQLLKNSESSMSEDQRKLMYKTIEESGKKLQNLVNDLLKKEKAELNLEELNLEEVRLEHLLQRVIELHQPTALSKEITVDLEINEPVQMELDRQKMDQVMGNLISNALKFTPRGGTVSIALDSTEERVKIVVNDTGVGIPTEDMDSLLNGSEKTIPVREGTQGEKGSGFGLDIIKQFTELHGGDVEVESVEGEGTRFTLFLPK
ncbi:MAG: hybrid sensor histidine kinase/response regulator [Balneolaceae bacterium]|nr:hybrid sensor histidine kinase/response regulator [Balneolaceae bacterium]